MEKGTDGPLPQLGEAPADANAEGGPALESSNVNAGGEEMTAILPII